MLKHIELFYKLHDLNKNRDFLSITKTTPKSCGHKIIIGIKSLIQLILLVSNLFYD